MSKRVLHQKLDLDLLHGEGPKNRPKRRRRLSERERNERNEDRMLTMKLRETLQRSRKEDQNDPIMNIQDFKTSDT